MPRPVALAWTLFAPSLVLAACGDGSKSDTDATAAEEVWTAPPRQACKVDDDCADDNACTWDEKCAADGLCTFRTLACDDENQCTSDTCDPSRGCVFDPFEGGSCDDGDPCTLGDTCKQGVCMLTEPLSCDDDNPCTADSCDRATGACVHEPLSDTGNLECDDGDACTEHGRCETGRCAYDPVGCPSDTDCQAWSCDPARGCVATPLEGACNDGDTCTTGDRCDATGSCVGAGVRDCDDGDPCTDDTCAPKTGCQHGDNTAACDDGVACTAHDRCDHGHCASGPDDCDDDNPCTRDVCDGSNGCKHFATVGACSDGDPCTVGDHCEAGACAAGAAASCDDGKLCTTDGCAANGLSAVCTHSYDNACIDTRVGGGYYGLVTVALDANATDGGAFDCLGTAALSLVTGETDVITGSASCEWSLSPTANHAVLVSMTARDTGERGTIHLPTTNVLARHFAGTLTLSGALKTTLTWDAFVTTDFGNPQILSEALGSTLVPPNLAAQHDVFVAIDADASDAEVPLCCQDDGTCFPGGASLCESVGAEAVAPTASGQCCLQTESGESCIDTPAAWCAKTEGAVYYGAKPSACCLGTGCALLAEEDCAASGGTYADGLDCGDGDDDGFADACPAPPGCGQPGLATCSLAGGTLRISPTGFMTIPLPGLGWTSAGTNVWTTQQDFSFDVGGHSVTIDVPGLVTVDCNDGVSVSGGLRIPGLSAAGFDLAAPEADAPNFTLSFKLGQDLAELGAPLSDCRTYVAFEGDSNFTIGSGADQSVLNNGSHVVLAVDPYDPGFYASAEGNILDGPSQGYVKRVGFGLSRGGHLKWTSLFPVPPAPGRPAEGTTLYGHVYASGDFTIPLPGGVVGVEVDGDSVYDLGPLADTGEAVLAGILAGDVGAIDKALSDLGTTVTRGQLLDQMAYGVNARSISLDVKDAGTFKLGEGTLVAAHNSIRFSANVGNLESILPDDTGGKLAPLFDALEKFQVKQVYHATGVIDPTGFELTLKADLTFGPVSLNDTGLTIRYRNGGFSVDVDDPSLSFDFLGWIDSLKDFLDCDFQTSEAGCKVGGFEVSHIKLETEGGRFVLSMESMVPGAVGKVTFKADVNRNGQFVLTGTASMQMGAYQTQDATLILSNDGVRVIATFPAITQSMSFDGTLYYDGSFLLHGLGTMGLVGFLSMQASATLSYCPSGSTCAENGNPVGDLVLLVTGDVDTPVGTATLQGELVYDDGSVDYDLTGAADFSLGGFASLDGTMRVTNIGTPRALLHLDLDLPLVTGKVDGELSADGGFRLAGTGALAIPGFSNLAAASISISKADGVHVSSKLGVAGAELAFEGRVGPDGFLFKGWNSFDLLGFRLDGQVTFAGDASGGDLSFAGGIDVGGNGVDVSGHISSGGQFAFTGRSALALFGYQLTSANVTFDNTGLSLAGKMSLLGIATFDMTGRIESSTDFKLTAGATAATFPGGLSGELSASLEKKGTRVTASGSGYATFLGAHANGSFVASSSGQFSFTGSLGFDRSFGNLSFAGQVTVQVGSSSFSASAWGKACADFLVDSACARVGASVDSDGEVCVDFPAVGTECVDIL